MTSEPSSSSYLNAQNHDERASWVVMVEGVRVPADENVSQMYVPFLNYVAYKEDDSGLASPLRERVLPPSVLQ